MRGLREQPARGAFGDGIGGQREAARDLAQDDAAPALGVVLAQPRERLDDLALAHLAGLGHLGGRERLRRQEQQRLDDARQLVHCAVTVIGPKFSSCCQRGLARLVELEQRPHASSPRSAGRRPSPPRRTRSAAAPARIERRCASRISTVTRGRAMWRRSSGGGVRSSPPSASASCHRLVRLLGDLERDAPQLLRQRRRAVAEAGLGGEPLVHEARRPSGSGCTRASARAAPPPPRPARAPEARPPRSAASAAT